MTNHETTVEQLLGWIEADTYRSAYAHGHNVGQLVGKLLNADAQRREFEAKFTESDQRARYDHLTGVYNLYGLMQSGQEQLNMNSNIAVLFVDLDKFKLVNDRQGHATGDELLRTAAGTISANIRGRDIVGRKGGDEFVVIADTTPRNEDDTSTAEERVRTMAERIGQEYFAATGETMSIGWILQDPDNLMSLDEMLHAADEQMYATKAVHHGGDTRPA